MQGAEASDEEFTEASHSSSDEDEQAALGPAAATAAAVVAATAECPNGDEWSSMVALAQGYWQQGKVRVWADARCPAQVLLNSGWAAQAMKAP